jgi:ribonuclease H2 subunit A
VDTVGDPDKYANKIRSRFPKMKVTVSKKADSLYPIVSASSICAKVVRDQIVQTWKINEFDEEKQSIQYGSCYPGGKINQIIEYILFFNVNRSSNQTIFE